MKQKQVVLMGFIGSGKTTLFNRITNSNELVKAGGKSVTMKVFLKESAYGQGFKALDTPGFGSTMKKVDHAAGIIAALTEGPINRIIIVVKFDRIDTMKGHVVKVLAPLMRFRPLITLLVTHWDLSNDKPGDEGLIEQTFRKYNLTSYIYTSTHESGSDTCGKIDREIENTAPEVINLIETEYNTQFDLAEFKEDLELEVEISKVELMIAFRNKAKIMKDFIKKQPENSPNLCDLMHVISLEGKKVAESTLNQFEKDNWDLCQRMIADSGTNHVFVLHTLLKKEMELDLHDLSKLAQEKMKKNAKHCFNFIKRCNNCRRIWMKVEGCTGNTVCGAVPRKDDLLTNSSPQKWVVQWVKDDIKIELNPNYEAELKQIKQQILKQKRQVLTIKNGQAVVGDGNEQYEIGEEGCQKVINWAEMLPLTEGELAELVDVGLLDYLCQKDKEISIEISQSQIPFQQKMNSAIQMQKQNIIRL